MADSDGALDRTLLATYLNDHLAGATVGRELASRAASQNRGNRFGRFLEGLLTEIEEDRRTLEDLMDALGVGKDRLKLVAGWAGERIGRLKPNGRLVGYSPLSRLVELEVLTLGVQGKLALWEALKAVSDLEPVLEEFDLDSLSERARRQAAGLEAQRVAAAELALTGLEQVGEADDERRGRARSSARARS